jgi:hypothetical protein
MQGRKQKVYDKELVWKTQPQDGAGTMLVKYVARLRDEFPCMKDAVFGNNVCENKINWHLPQYNPRRVSRDKGDSLKAIIQFTFFEASN